MPFALSALATWRLTHLLVHEDGPGDVVVRLRRAAGASVIGRIMDCFYCASVWVALPMAVGLSGERSRQVPGRGSGGAQTAQGSRAGRWRRRITAWLALSGAACLLERVSRPAGNAAPDAARAGEPGTTAGTAPAGGPDFAPAGAPAAARPRRMAPEAAA